MNHWLLKSNWFDNLQDGKMEGAAFVGAMFGFMNGFCWALAFYVGAGFLPSREVAA